jgi:hypothetical protein
MVSNMNLVNVNNISLIYDIKSLVENDKMVNNFSNKNKNSIDDMLNLKQTNNKLADKLKDLKEYCKNNSIKLQNSKNNIDTPQRNLPCYYKNHISNFYKENSSNFLELS